MTNTHNFYSIIIAAGAGTRMKSDKPKVLHTVANKPMLVHIIDQIKLLNPQEITIVYGHKGEQVMTALKDYSFLKWSYQEKQLGTAHAVNCGVQDLTEDLPTLVSFSDNPLIRTETFKALLDKHTNEENADLVLLTTVLDNPKGYGRVVRDNNNNICQIIEEKDCTDEQRLIQEVFTGILVCNSLKLKALLQQVDNKNAQNEYYLTDLVKLCYKQGLGIKSVITDKTEVSSANDKYQLAQLEDYYQQRVIQAVTTQGLILKSAQPNTFTLRGELEFGKDCSVDLNCIFNGKVKLGNNVQIGTGCVLIDCEIADNTIIEPFSIIEKSYIGPESTVGPYARIRPNTKVIGKARIGNFVEMKNTTFGEGSKACHLAYLGDSEVGKKSNIACGVITCNYDGVNKFKTIIGDDVFVGSDCQLVAPLNIASGTTIAAGTTVLKDIDESQLIYNKKEVVKNKDWQRPTKVQK